MKKQSLALILFILFGTNLFAQLPTAEEIAGEMTIGWNIGNSLEVPSGGETGWGNPRVSQELIDMVRDAGFNTIRIPCGWYSNTDKITLEINPSFLSRVGEVVDYCYANDMYVIINCHWDGGWLENNVTTAQRDTVNIIQRRLWTQIAEYFKDYDEHLLFAGANEPNVENTTQMSVLMTYHQTFIDAVRATGGNNSSRVLIIQGPSTDIEKTNNLMKTFPADSIEGRLMAEVHYYTPWNFCGLTEDASWGKMFYFWGKDYHSTTNTSRNATWGEEDAVENYFKSMKTKFVDNGIPVILGEYGANNRLSLTGEDLTLHTASREYYYKYVTNAAVRNGMIPVYWDNGYNGNNTMAIFNRNNNSVFDQRALDALMEGAIPVTSVEEELNYKKDSDIDYLNVSPNPVSSSTSIEVSFKESAEVNISVFNILGQEVASFNNLIYPPGLHSVTWNTGSLPAGIYFINLNTTRDNFTKKVLLIR